MTITTTLSWKNCFQPSWRCEYWIETKLLQGVFLAMIRPHFLVMYLWVQLQNGIFIGIKRFLTGGSLQSMRPKSSLCWHHGHSHAHPIPNPPPWREHNSPFPQIWQLSVIVHLHAQSSPYPISAHPTWNSISLLPKIADASNSSICNRSKPQLHPHIIFKLTILSLEWCQTSARIWIPYHSGVVRNFPNFPQPYFLNLTF